VLAIKTILFGGTDDVDLLHQLQGGVVREGKSMHSISQNRSLLTRARRQGRRLELAAV
jgi:hypothetical protein